jgi:hypothetical protein
LWCELVVSGRKDIFILSRTLVVTAQGCDLLSASMALSIQFEPCANNGFLFSRPDCFGRACELTSEVLMKDQSQQQDQGGAPVDRNDPAIDPQVPGEGAPGNDQSRDQGVDQNRDQSRDENTAEPESADSEVDQKNVHNDNDNEFSPGFKPEPDRPSPGEDTDADIDTDGG